jgi:ubiquinone/menaquinone biosynthesis C-methylase UbiE
MYSKRQCPICARHEVIEIFNRTIENFDEIEFNRDILIVQCSGCGMVFNDIKTDESTIDAHYKNDTLYFGESGFGTGGITEADLNRYARYMEMLQPIVKSKDIFIADVGCGKGGFLSFLKSNEFSKLHGIEIDQKCVEYARNKFGLNIESGTINKLPFQDNEVDLLIFNHVLEHIENPLIGLAEARRVLKSDGCLFIEVPDASRYFKGRIFDYFWFCMREHINHFDSVHLSLLLEKAGISNINKFELLMPYNQKFSYPSLCAIYKKENIQQNKNTIELFTIKDALDDYIKNENWYVKKNQKMIEDIFSSGSKIFFWGISLEFFALYSFTDLKRRNINGLLDKNILKQKKTIGGMPIKNPESIYQASDKTKVVITSIFNSSTMVDILKHNSFNGDIITIDEQDS